MHMALQIFPPNNSFLGLDGLYKVRKWVFATWILFPCFTAALAFANPDGAYQAQGAFCWLPIRPFWYRLALSWVPRYLIWLYIMWVAIRIYSHVGYEFKVFGQERDRSWSTDLSAASSAERGAIEKAVKEHHSQVKSNEKVADDEIAPDDSSMPGPMFASSHVDDEASSAAASRRMSLPTWHSPFGGISSPKADISITPTAISNPTSRRGSRQIASGVLAEDFMAPPGFDFTHPRGSVSTMNSVPHSINGASADPTLSPIVEGRTSTSHASSVDTDIGARVLRQRRRAIQRQLRILFIYPVVYMAMWLIPFISHCLSYSDYFAQHPIFAISLLSSFCQTFMGFADVCVFCWRERPWRHIPGSDGTFFGSFVFWKCYGEEKWSRRESKAPGHMPSLAEQSQNQSNAQSETGLIAALRRWSTSRKGSSANASSVTHSVHRPGMRQKRAFSSGASRTKEAELAHQRLKLEREDYERNRRSLDLRRESAVNTMQPRKEWFDQNHSEDTIRVMSERSDGH